VSRLQLADVELAARVVDDPGSVAAFVASGEAVRIGTNEAFALVFGITENQTRVYDRPVIRGRAISGTDVDTRRRVSVLGSAAADRLFGDVDPIGRQVTIAGVRFRVVGVYEEVGSAFGVSRDEELHIPVTTAQRLFGVDRVDAIAVKAPSAEGIDLLQFRLVNALRDRYPGESSPLSPRPRSLARSGASSACSRCCWPPLPRSPSWSAGSASPTSCW